MKGVDPMLLPLNRFLNYVFVWCVQNSDEKERAKFVAQLWTPPPEERVPGRVIPKASPWSAENEASALHGLALAMRG